MSHRLCQIWRRCTPPFSAHLGKTRRGCINVRGLRYMPDKKWGTVICHLKPALCAVNWQQTFPWSLVRRKAQLCRRSRQDSFTLFAPGATPRLKIRGWELRALRGGFSIVNSYINGLSLPAPGRGCLDIPLRFFRAGGKNSGAQSHQIWHACSEILCAHCVQVSAPGHVRSGHKVMLT